MRQDRSHTAGLYCDYVDYGGPAILLSRRVDQHAGHQGYGNSGGGGDGRAARDHAYGDAEHSSDPGGLGRGHASGHADTAPPANRHDCPHAHPATYRRTSTSHGYYHPAFAYSTSGHHNADPYADANCHSLRSHQKRRRADSHNVPYASQ